VDRAARVGLLIPITAIVLNSAASIFVQSPVILTLILIGILVATGSSTLSYYMTAPRTAQALARDRIILKPLHFLGRDPGQIRIIRKIADVETQDQVRIEMQGILDHARLTGEVLILPEDEESIHDTIKKHSRDARLIIMGIPGEPKSGIVKFFALDKVFLAGN
jgi:hypothetical protein